MREHINILFPLYIDHWGAINTVHREVARRLSDDFRVTALVGNGSHCIDQTDFDEIVRIPNTDNNLRRSVNYTQLYASEFDLVQTWGGISDYLVFFSKLKGAKVVHTIHSENLNHALFRKLADQVTSVSEYVRQISYKGSNADEVKVIPNGINLDIFNPNVAKTEKGLISYVGKNACNKNPELVFKIAQNSPNLRFAILGPSFDSDEITVNQPPNLTCKSKLDRQEVAELFSRSQIVLCPYEGAAFCMTALESMASGTPVVGLDSGNLQCLISEDSGILCEDTNVKTWKNAIKYIRKTQNTYSPREEAERYDWMNIATRYEELYRELAFEPQS